MRLLRKNLQLKCVWVQAFLLGNPEPQGIKAPRVQGIPEEICTGQGTEGSQRPRDPETLGPGAQIFGPHPCSNHSLPNSSHQRGKENTIALLSKQHD